VWLRPIYKYGDPVSNSQGEKLRTNIPLKILLILH